MPHWIWGDLSWHIPIAALIVALLVLRRRPKSAAGSARKVRREHAEHPGDLHTQERSVRPTSSARRPGEWEVWYRDTFDRECPAKVEVRGKALADGLAELWARYLTDTVEGDGTIGFSHFWLEWDERRIDLTDKYQTQCWSGARRLRAWLVCPTDHESGYVANAAPVLLRQLTLAHARHADRPRAAEWILTMALNARDQPALAAPPTRPLAERHVGSAVPCMMRNRAVALRTLASADS
jgi:hypothetical protein